MGSCVEHGNEECPHSNANGSGNQAAQLLAFAATPLCVHLLFTEEFDRGNATGALGIRDSLDSLAPVVGFSFTTALVRPYGQRNERKKCDGLTLRKKNTCM